MVDTQIRVWSTQRMTSAVENRSTREQIVPVTLCQRQIPYSLF